MPQFKTQPCWHLKPQPGPCLLCEWRNLKEGPSHAPRAQHAHVFVDAVVFRCVWVAFRDWFLVRGFCSAQFLSGQNDVEHVSSAISIGTWRDSRMFSPTSLSHSIAVGLTTALAPQIAAALVRHDTVQGETVHSLLVAWTTWHCPLGLRSGSEGKVYFPHDQISPGMRDPLLVIVCQLAISVCSSWFLYPLNVFESAVVPLVNIDTENPTEM